MQDNFHCNASAQARRTQQKCSSLSKVLSCGCIASMSINSGASCESAARIQLRTMGASRNFCDSHGLLAAVIALLVFGGCSGFEQAPPSGAGANGGTAGQTSTGAAASGVAGTAAGAGAAGVSSGGSAGSGTAGSSPGCPAAQTLC